MAGGGLLTGLIRLLIQAVITSGVGKRKSDCRDRKESRLLVDRDDIVPTSSNVCTYTRVYLRVLVKFLLRLYS
jgi:hypothetical protein